MSDDTLWAAKLHLASGKPATILGTDTIRDICEAYVKAVAELDAYRNPSEMFPFRPFIPKHAFDCDDQNCDRRCMLTKVTRNARQGLQQPHPATIDSETTR